MKFPFTVVEDYDQNLQSMCHNLSINSNLNKFFHTPYFKRFFNSKNLTEMIPFYEVRNYIQNIVFIENIWNDITFDYFQKYHLIIENTDFSDLNNQFIQKWMKENVKYKTFLNMMNSYCGKIGFYHHENLIRDTFNQLEQLLTGDYEVTPPKRWRFIEFHDHISYLYLKKDIVNTTHENEFIPFPISKDKWKIYQPKDTLELALWGKKVRNCVLSYESKIQNKDSIIVLIEEKDIPKYTIELDYNSTNLVKQQVGIGNSQLTKEESDLCSNLIQFALKK